MSNFEITAIAVTYNEHGFSTDSERIFNPLLRRRFDAAKLAEVEQQIAQVARELAGKDAVILARVRAGRAPPGFRKLAAAGGNGLLVRATGGGGMTQRYVTLPNGRTCSLGTYVKAWRELKRLPLDTGVSGFGYSPEPAGYILDEMRKGMQDRISSGIPRTESWAGKYQSRRRGTRKYDPDWQRAAYMLASRVNTPRLIVREPEVMPEFRERLAHRITREGDL